MKLEELTDCTAEQLEKMTDAELLEHFKPMLNVTRPDRARIYQPQKQEKLVMTPELQKKMDFLRDNGIDIGFLHRKKK